MSESGVLRAGWRLAANDDVPVSRHRNTVYDPEAIAVICASRMGQARFEVLSAPGCPMPIRRDNNGVLHFARYRAAAR